MKAFPKEEYKILDYYTSPIQIVSSFQLIADAFKNKSWKLLDLKAVNKTINYSLKYLKVYKRYMMLREASDNLLEYDDSGFILNNNVFKTLNEVSRALKHKAFL